MSGVQPPENLMSSFGTNGANDRPLHARIADLLDDVTVDGESLKHAGCYLRRYNRKRSDRRKYSAAHRGAPAPALSTPSEAPAPRRKARIRSHPHCRKKAQGVPSLPAMKQRPHKQRKYRRAKGLPAHLSAEQAPVRYAACAGHQHQRAQRRACG